MSQYERVQRQAESSGMSSARETAATVSSVGNTLATALLKQVMDHVKVLREKREALQHNVATVADHLASSPAATLTTEQDLQEKDKLIHYADNDEHRNQIINDVKSVNRALNQSLNSGNLENITEAQRTIIRFSNLVDEIGVAQYVLDSALDRLDDLKLFSEVEPSQESDHGSTVEPEMASEVEPLVLNPEADTAIEQEKETGRTLPVHQIESAPQGAKEPTPQDKYEQTDYDLDPLSDRLSEKQINVIHAALNVSNPNEGISREELESGLKEQSSEAEVGEPSKAEETRLVSVYESETFEIRRQGNTVSIFDATSDSKEPIFQFEQNGRQIKVIKDDITNEPATYRKFKAASDNLKTLNEAYGKKASDVFADKSHQAQARFLGELAPRGSAALATAHLSTNNKSKVAMLSDGERRITYQRISSIKEDGQPSEKFIVTQDGEGIKPGNSIVAVSEDGTIVTQNHPNDYAKLNYIYQQQSAAEKAERQAAALVEKQSKQPILKSNRGDEGR
ncbi:MAG: hypothetical protein WA947_08470 [Phormidesmis sp.]